MSTSLPGQPSRYRSQSRARRPADPEAVRPSARASVWRAEVLRLKQRHPRGTGPPRLYTGTPGREVVWIDLETIDPGDGLDPPLRVDLLSALMSRIRPTSCPAPVWLARTGPHRETALDRCWLVAARCAAGESGIALRFVVVTRRGWFDPATGRGEQWQRARDRRP